MAALQFPCTIFKTKNCMDDYSANDMRCGDLTETALKRDYHLVDVSTRVNPYLLTKITPFSHPLSRFYGSRGEGEKITRQECTRILFDEFRHLSQFYAIAGPYRYTIRKMITHMQNGNGTPFRSMLLNRALKEQILNDNTENSTRILLSKAFNTFTDWEKIYFPIENKAELTKTILAGKLPKFDRFQDNFNGMGISVHDTWATHITIKSFMTDMEATIEISGERNERKM